MSFYAVPDMLHVLACESDFIWQRLSKLTVPPLDLSLICCSNER